MTQAIEGTYRDGRVELSEKPRNVRQSRVIVLFVDNVTAESQPPMVSDRQASEANSDKASPAVLTPPDGESNTLLLKGTHLGGGPYISREEFYNAAFEARRKRRAG